MAEDGAESVVEQLQSLFERVSAAHVSQRQALYEEMFQLAESLPKESIEDATLDALEMHRTEYVSTFLPDREFCKSWLQDIITYKDPTYVSEIYQKLFKIYPDISIFAVFYSYMMNSFENEKIVVDEVRSQFENASVSCGMDIFTGPIFWKLYREFEIEECEDLLETSSDPSTIQTAKSHVIRVFRRQLALPLVDNEQVLREFDEILSRICVESDLHLIDPQSLQSKFELAVAQRNERIEFENALVSEEYQYLRGEYQYSQFWKPYIDFEIEKSEMSRAQRLFERALMDCKEALACWENFVEFARFEVKNWNLVEDILSRCSRLHFNEAKVWQQLIQAMEVVERPLELVSRTLHTGLQNIFASAENYVSLLSSSCDYFRRHLISVRVKSGAHKKEEVILAIERLRTSFDAAEAFLDTYYPSWVDGFLMVTRYRVRVEEELISEVAESLPSPYQSKYASQAEKIWERAIKKFSKHLHIWLECIEWGRTSGNIEFCRSLFKKAVASVASPHELCRSWVVFERQSGSMEQLLEAEDRLRSLGPVSASQDASSTNHPEYAISREPQQVRSEKRKTDSEVTYESVSDQRRVEHEVKRMKPASLPSTAKQRKYSVFLKNLSFECSQRDIESHFASCEGLIEAKLILLHGGKFRGTATIDFESEKGQKQAMRLHGTPLLGREVAVQILRPDESNAKAQPTTVFVSKMNRETTSEELRSHFEGCGEILAARIILDRISGKSKVHRLAFHRNVVSDSA